MTELSDYQRMVERPMIAKWEIERAALKAALQSSQAEVSRLREGLERLAEGSWNKDKPLRQIVGFDVFARSLLAGEG